MKKEYDFSKGERGKFFRPNVQLNLPVYLEPDLKKYFPDSDSVNDALRCLVPLLGKRRLSPRSKRA